MSSQNILLLLRTYTKYSKNIGERIRIYGFHNTLSKKVRIVSFLFIVLIFMCFGFVQEFLIFARDIANLNDVLDDVLRLLVLNKNN